LQKRRRVISSDDDIRRETALNAIQPIAI